MRGVQARAWAQFQLAIDRQEEQTVTDRIRNHLLGTLLPDDGYPVCHCCDLWHPKLANRRLNTAYVEEWQNWHFFCPDCYAEGVEYYEELWAECLR